MIRHKIHYDINSLAYVLLNHCVYMYSNEAPMQYTPTHSIIILCIGASQREKQQEDDTEEDLFVHIATKRRASETDDHDG